MKLGEMIENMLMGVSELFIILINKKIPIMLNRLKHVILRLGPNLKTVLLSIFVWLNFS